MLGKLACLSIRRAVIETTIIQLSVADNNRTFRSDVTRVNNESGREDSISVMCLDGTFE